MTFKLHFAGPELSEGMHQKTESKNDRLSATFFRGTTSEYLLNGFEHLGAMKEALPRENTVFIGYNPGFGSGYDKLLISWALDILFLVNLGYPVVFTQASDFSDLKGEQRVFERMFKKSVKFFMEPLENPFRAVTTYSEDSEAKNK